MEAVNVQRAITTASQANAALSVANITGKLTADVLARNRRRGTMSRLTVCFSVCLSVYLAVN